MLRTEADSSLPNNNFSALVQLKLLERRLDKYAYLKQRYAKTIHDDLDKGYITKVDKSYCFKVPATPSRKAPAQTLQSSLSIKWRSEVPG